MLVNCPMLTVGIRVVRASKSGRDVRFKFRNGGTYVYHGYGNTLAKELYDSLLLKGVVVEVLVDFSEVQKPWFHEFHYSPVYEIHVNGKIIRSYEEKMASIDRGTSIMPWFGMFLIFISVYEYRKYRKQYRSKT